MPGLRQHCGTSCICLHYGDAGNPDGDTLDHLMWSFVGGRPMVNRWEDKVQIPASTPESDAMSKAMKKAGFTFFGTTICYAHMQAAGMVNDHLVTCFRYRELRARI
jgi:DNA-3-methyladenine glycosylase I